MRFNYNDFDSLVEKITEIEASGMRPEYIIMGKNVYDNIEKTERERNSLAYATVSQNIDSTGTLFGLPIVLDFYYPDRITCVVPSCSLRTMHILRRKAKNEQG